MFLGCAAALLAAAGGEVKLGTYARELGGLADPTGVVLGDDGTTYVLEWALDRVRVFGPDGVERASWGGPGSDWGQLSGPRDIARGPDDNLCIADTGNHRVSVWTEEGEFKWAFGGPGELNAPHGLAVRGNSVVVADTLNDRVRVYDWKGQAGVAFGEWGAEPGQFNHPLDVAVDGEGRIYVADSDNHRVQKFSAEGEFLASWGDFGPHPGFFASPSGIAFHDGLLFVTDRENHRVQVFDTEGVPAYTWGLHALLPRESQGKLHYPRNVAIAPGGELAVVAEDLENRLQYFGPTPGEAEPPAASAVDRSTASHYGQHWDAGAGLMVLVEPTRPAVRVYDVATDVAGAEPIEISWIGAWGRRFGQMLRPEDVALDVERRWIHVADPANRKIETWVYQRKEGPLGFDPQMLKLAFSRDLSRAGAEQEGVEAVALELHPDGHLVAIDAQSRAVVQIGSTEEHERGGSRSAEVTPVWNGQLAQEFFAHDPNPMASSGPFREPLDLAFSPEGDRLYVVDRLAAQVRWVTITREPVLGLRDGPGGTLEPLMASSFVRPSGIAVDDNGRVYVSDAHRHAIYVFEADGRFVTHFGQEGLRALEFFKPSGLALRKPGELLILDHGNHRGQIASIGDDGQGTFVHAFGARFFTQLIRQEAAERARAGSGN